LPPISALFILTFDTHRGYTLTHSHSLPNLDLTGVEFKSLPSGLHRMSSDLVYFLHPSPDTHTSHAGISAFLNTPRPDLDRGALMLSVGCLVPLTSGRLGRAWRHAKGLRELAKQVASDNPSGIEAVKAYWEEHRVSESETSSEAEILESPSTPSSLRYRRAGKQPPSTRQRSISDMTFPATPTTPMNVEPISPDHPILSLPGYLETFGPLVFPLYRAALLRKRILFIVEPPVERACEWVYDTSILANIPSSVAELVRTAPTRLKPLFSVGVSDIGMLEAEGKLGGWVACTTDEILKMKTNLYDVVVTFPAKGWPVVEEGGKVVRATQRDLRRWRVLKTALGLEEEEEPCAEVERVTWGELAYSGFLWWASAGEKRACEEDDEERVFGSRLPITPYRDEEDESSSSDDDTAPLLLDAASPGKSPQRRTSTASTTHTLTTPELDIITYFHRLTTRTFSTLSEVIQTQSDEDYFDNAPTTPDLTDRESEEMRRRGEEKVVVLGLEDVQRAGGDMWSGSDRRWMGEVGWKWFGRSVGVEEGGWGCC
ncbi:hypothetical protein BJ508DRAFT_186507, partial [Ascobolus immersus RN42]